MEGNTMSKIEWTDVTWNCVTGCTKISLSCKNCYAEKMTRRLAAMGQAKYANGFKVTTHVDIIEQPLEWKTPRRIFVNSMSDTFHNDVPEDFIFSLFDTMNRADWHQFQVLTKRSERFLKMNPYLDWSENIWMGVTIENADYIQRIDHLRATSAHIKFLSLEPLLGPIPNLNLDGIDWVIVGGESGAGARPMPEEWVLDIRDQCIDKGVPFFFKQWGGVNKKKNGKLLDGKIWGEYPVLNNKLNKPNISDDIYSFVECLTPEEKSILLKRIPEAQLTQLFREASFL
jgi:protein gp37